MNQHTIPFRPDTRTNPGGGRVNPSPAPEGWTSTLPVLTVEEYNADQIEAIKVRAQVARGDSFEDLAWFFEKYTGTGEVPEILEAMLHRAMTQSELDGAPCQSWPQAAALAVKDDKPEEFAQDIRNHANEHDWPSAKRFRRTEEPNIDFIGRVIDPVEHMIVGLGDAMHDICFREKTHQEEVHCRPEDWVAQAHHPELAEALAVLVTAYLAPLHSERPAGHGFFAGWIAARAAEFYNEHDPEIMVAAMWLALFRVLAGQHVARSCVEGLDLAVAAA